MFGKRFHLINVRGISIGFDVSWFFIAILLTWSLSSGYFPFYHPGLEESVYLLMGFIGMLGLFVSVILHELVHALTAKRLGLPISRITLFLFGGIAELKKDPPGPKVEFLVAIAGPLVSVLLAIAFRLAASMGEAGGWPVPVVGVLAYLSLLNLVVVVFNMVPAFPLDGGRVLRSLLWWKSGDLGWATKISSQIGSSFGFALILMGIAVIIMGNFIAGLWWMILGLFLQSAAGMSQTRYAIKKQLRGEKVARYMIATPDTAPPDVDLQQFIDDYVYKTYHHLYPVVRDGELLGYVSLNEVRAVDRDQWRKTLVKDILVPLDQLVTLSPQMDVVEALGLFGKTSAECLLVTDGKRLIGLLGGSDLSKIISIKLELGG